VPEVIALHPQRSDSLVLTLPFLLPAGVVPSSDRIHDHCVVDISLDYLDRATNLYAEKFERAL
jgi:hypothetical protein